MIVGCQFSLYPMSNDFEKIILSAIANLKNRKDIKIETDNVSTMLTGEIDKVFDLVEECFLSAANNTKHAALEVTFSHGCPGEPADNYCIPEKLNTQKKLRENVKKKLSGISVAAHFAIYPMNDKNYMDIIYEEIKNAKKTVLVEPLHYCTKLTGDTTNVFLAIKNSLENVSGKTAHVVITATVSKH